MNVDGIARMYRRRRRCCRMNISLWPIACELCEMEIENVCRICIVDDDGGVRRQLGSCGREAGRLLTDLWPDSIFA